ncbi:ATP-grasp domain-containing protein [Achromobacter sp. DH1f]|uniref:ATP-grasp domain-containing protein n=1 Tax=Achromobacter sp. DH1f TaxID=1397275 RepID=UPI001E5A3DC2
MLQDAALAYGGVPWTREAFQHAGVSLPVDDPYPAAARFALGRRVWREERLASALVHPRPLFIKPADNWKRFTGFVADSLIEIGDLRFQGYSKARPVWCSEVGVLATSGATVLVEVNDGFSVGAYGSIAPALFFDVLSSRWSELMGGGGP